MHVMIMLRNPAGDIVFFSETAPTDIYTLSLHDALPISRLAVWEPPYAVARPNPPADWGPQIADRKSTRLNSSHLGISYAVFCLKKKRTFCFTHLHKCHSG